MIGIANTTSDIYKSSLHVDPQWIFPILREVDLEFPALPVGYRLEGSLPPTGGASLGKPMLAVFLILGLLAMISGLVAARRRG